MDWQAFALSLKLATVTTAILLASPCRWRRCWCWAAAAGSLRSKRWPTLPLVLPPTVLGFFLLVLLGPRTAIGRGITALLGHPLAFSFAGLVVGRSSTACLRRAAAGGRIRCGRPVAGRCGAAARRRPGAPRSQLLVPWRAARCWPPPCSAFCTPWASSA